jgi:hypothetical protein
MRHQITSFQYVAGMMNMGSKLDSTNTRRHIACGQIAALRQTHFR